MSPVSAGRSATGQDVPPEVDVVIVGAGPVGLMLAGELRLAGVRPLVLERQAQLREIPKANGLGGQILELLRYRGLLEKFEEACTAPSHPAPRYPFGEVHVDFSPLPEPPLRGLTLPQPELERLLDERARELGAVVRRGHEVVDLTQDGTTVTAEVNGPDGRYQVTSRYLVGCDGGRSRIRELAGIAFPGATYPEVNRLGQITLPDSLAGPGAGEALDLPGRGTIKAGFTRTERGVFGYGALTPEVLLVSTTENEDAETDDNVPMTLAEFQDSVRRVLGVELPLKETIRLSRYHFQARQAERYRSGRILLAGDAAHLFPATGVGLNTGMLDAVNLAWKLAADINAWAPPGLVDTYHGERQMAGMRTMLHTQAQVALRRGQDAAADALRTLFLELFADEQPLRRIGGLLAGTDIRYPLHVYDHHALTGTFVPDFTLQTEHGTTTSVAELMQTAQPILLDLADRPELREAAREWDARVIIQTAKTRDRPADALLIRPDAHIAWTAAIDEPTNTAVLALRKALTAWFGTPRGARTEAPVSEAPQSKASTYGESDVTL
ncbi:FAD-dependent monooxygenase [Amycolatopsis sp. cmx-11-32]|uniref:FAD-dependent monooxygenase n=1 Tax=Amycolatopsis sp. cmx-11-32 TaxID=2785796 RepID=UPI0039E49D97